MIRRRLAAALLLAAGLATASPAAGDEPNPSLADFYGETIDLREGWGEAQACASDGGRTTCFRTEAEMDEFLGEVETELALFASCSTSTRLYDGTSYGTPVLALTTQSTWHNLSALGFDNITSSYRIGACAALFASGAGGSGSYYPGSTAANVSFPSMVAGWNNVVSSVWIY